MAGKRLGRRTTPPAGLVSELPQSAAAHFYTPPTTEQHDVPWRDFQQATKFAVMLGILAGGFYLSFVYDRSHENVPYLWILTLIAESIVVLHTLGIWATLVGYRPDIPEPEEIAVIRRSLVTGEIETPTVDVYVCCAGEPEHIVLKTVIAAQEMQLPHNTWILDDGKKDDLRAAAELLGVGYIRRTTNAHAKAGNVNAAFQRTTGRFLVILDADHVPRPDMLVQTLPFLIANPSVAMVQTPQTYFTEGRGMVSEGAAVSQDLFYEAIMPAKNMSNAAFCVGTNVVFRRSALKSLTTRELTPRERRRQKDSDATTTLTALGEEYPEGGIWVGSNSEDIWTSLELHRRGWRTVFLPKVLTQGLTPDRLGPFLKQQFRWASGGWEVLLVGKVLKAHQLTLSQKLQYLLVPSHYCLAFATCVFSVMAPIYLLTDQSPIAAGFSDWAIHYLPFYMLTIAIPFIQAGRIKVSAIIVSIAAAPAQMRGLLMTAAKRKATWSVTNSKQGGFSFKMILPHLFVAALCLVSLFVGWTIQSQNKTSRIIASFFCVVEIASVVAMVVGARRAERMADANEASEPDLATGMELLREYVDIRNRRRDGIAA